MYLEEIMLSRQTKRSECIEVRVRVQSSIYNVIFFCPPLSFWTMCPIVVFIALQSRSSNSSLFSSTWTVQSCSRSLQIARQMFLFTSIFPSGRVSTTSPPPWIWLLYPLKREGWQRGGSSYGCEINKTCHLYEQRWALKLFAALVWPVSPSSAVNGSLCYSGTMRGRTWESHNKGDCCGFREADGAVHQMGVWGSNKVVDLVAGTRTENSANSWLWSAQMLPMRYCRPATFKHLDLLYQDQGALKSNLCVFEFRLWL